MKRITVTETESFSTEVISTAKNLVYVPGFAWTGETGSTAIQGKFREPHLCTSTAEFETYFGTTPPRFKANQTYPAFVLNSTPGFPSTAIPATTWFKGETATTTSDTIFGDPDPSWLYAHELLTAGIPVLYERMNKGISYPFKSDEYSASTVYSKQSLVWYTGTTTSGKSYSGYFKCHTAMTTAGTAPTFNDSGVPQTNAYWTPWCGYDIYDKNKSYAIGDIVCVVENTTATYYQYTTIGYPSGAFEAIPAWDSTTSYVAGDFVYRTESNVDVLYRCKEATSGTWSASKWDAATNGFDTTTAMSDWAANTEYTVNATVKHTVSGTTTYYRCKTAHTSGSAFSDTNWIINYGDYRIVNPNTSALTDGVYYYNMNDDCAFNKWVVSAVGTKVEIDTPDVVEAYDVTVAQFYDEIIGSANSDPDPVFADTDDNVLKDNSLYGISFITTGGYPNFEYKNSNGLVLAAAMTKIASDRGDAVALIDHTNHPSRAFLGTTSVYGSLSDQFGISETIAKYATMITPWAAYTSTYTNTDYATVIMPGSFGYLKCYAATLPYNDNCLAIAGVNRGRVVDLVYLNTTKTLTNTIAENMQVADGATGIAINPITYINNYGYCIWGNNTLLPHTTTNSKYASLDLNLRNTCNDIKKAARDAAVAFMFEQNTSTLWLDFKDEISTTLNKLQSKNVISDYQLLQLTTTDKAKVACQITVWPVKAVDSFDINVVLTDTDVTVA